MRTSWSSLSTFTKTNPTCWEHVRLAPVSTTGAGADEVTATVSYAGKTLTQTRGFEVSPTRVVLGLRADTADAVAPYGQKALTLSASGASVGSPVSVNIGSACVSLGRATLSPATAILTSPSMVIQYEDRGCGALQSTDLVRAAVAGSADASEPLQLTLTRPDVSSVVFLKASPEQIYLKGSGQVESSMLTFEVRDGLGNPLKDEAVTLRLLTGAGGVLLNGSNGFGQDLRLQSDAQGRVAAFVNAGSQPTPVRVQASLDIAGRTVTTVSGNLSVGVGLPSQANFSLSQTARNIEGFDIDGTRNAYQVIASDRSGNPVPAGTAINFVAEGGSIEAMKQSQLVDGLSRAVVNFVSSAPRPHDGRVTITAYALGEESFIDSNGNNVYDAGEAFQDLGILFKDRNFNGRYDPEEDELIPLSPDRSNENQTCETAFRSNPILALDVGVPTTSTTSGQEKTCSGGWSGPGRVYVRRAVETILSTSAARPLWVDASGLATTCRQQRLQISATGASTVFAEVGRDTWFSEATEGSLLFFAADANPGLPKQGLAAGYSRTDASNYAVLPRFNPLAAGSVVSVSTPTAGFTASLNGGSPVPSTSEPSIVSVGYRFTDATVNQGTVNIVFRSPSGLQTVATVTVDRAAATQPAQRCSLQSP